MLDKLLAVSGRYPAERVQVAGHAPLAERIAAGQGGVLVTAHIGCLELCRAMARLVSPVQLNILVHTRHAEQFNRVLKRLDPNLSMRLIEVTEISPATAALLDARVQAGEWVVLAGDRVPVGSQQVVRRHFLGHDANFPIGPYVLAALFKCPLWWMGCTHEGTGYRIRFAPLAESVKLPRRDRDSALRGYAQAYVDALTATLSDAPFDWFNFFPFWDQAPDVRR
jgi:predicted LPLAT superfamily acyltransferase